MGAYAVVVMLAGLVNVPIQSRSKCPNASNPFHTTCTEACMQKISNLGKKKTEDKSLGFKSVVSKKEEKMENCKYASNPYHRCAETCIQKINAGTKKSKGGSAGLNFFFFLLVCPSPNLHI